mmetsp:Transcript_5855/g.24212  ORF Transcript_5855/g.24212 Transcript_5855/m.24212 type:complete len:293 (+) Transcript_5855:2648-3526(+)
MMKGLNYIKLIATSVAAQAEEHLRVPPGEVHDVPGPGQSLRNLPRRLDAPQLHERRSRGLSRLADEPSRLGLALRADDGRLALLLRLEHDELRALSLLLRHLLRLDRLAVLRREGEVGQGDVLQDDAEIVRSLAERGRHLVAHLRAQGEQLLSLVLRDCRLEHLVTDGRQNPLVVVGTAGHVDLREPVHVGAEQKPEREVHLLQILGPGDRRDGPWAGAEVVDGGALDERDQEVGALQRRLGQHTLEAVKHHRRGPSIDVVDGGVQRSGAHAEADGRPGQIGERICRRLSHD